MAVYLLPHLLAHSLPTAIYDFSGYDSKRSSDCLLHGPTLGAILEMVDRFLQFPKLKVSVDFDDVGRYGEANMVGQYKSPNIYFHSRLLDGKPSFDTGDVRRQCF